MAMTDEDIHFIGRIIRQTDMAICFRERGADQVIWLPRSQVAIIHAAESEGLGSSEVKVIMPEWLAEKKGLL